MSRDKGVTRGQVICHGMLFVAVLLGTFCIVYRRRRSIWGLAPICFMFGMSAAFFGLI